jgi:hypothetical protein
MAPPFTPAMEATLTIAPPPRSRMLGSTRCTHRNGLVRSTMRISSQSSSVVASVLATRSMAALLTRMSMPPKSVTAATSASTAPSVLKSAP